MQVVPVWSLPAEGWAMTIFVMAQCLNQKQPKLSELRWHEPAIVHYELNGLLNKTAGLQNESSVKNLLYIGILLCDEKLVSCSAI